MKNLNKENVFSVIILASFLIPVLKQYVFISVLDAANASIYGFLFAVSMIVVGIGNLGSLELATVSSSKNKSLKNYNAFVFYSAALLFTLFIAITIVSIVFFYVEIEPFQAVLFLLSILALLFFQIVLRYIRSIGFTRCFFFIITLKLTIDLVLILIFVKAIGLGLEDVFLIEIISVTIVTLLLTRKKFIRRFLRSVLAAYSKIYTVLPQYKSKIIIFFMVAVLSLLIVSIDRLLFFEVLDKTEYKKYLYLAIILSMFYSASSLINTFIHREIAKIEGDKHLVNQWTKTKLIKYKIPIILLPIVTFASILLFSILFLEDFKFTWPELLLTTLIGTVHLYNFFEKILYISANKMLGYLQALYLLLFLVFFLVFDYGVLIQVLAVYFVLKLLYFFSTYFLFRVRYSSKV